MAGGDRRRGNTPRTFAPIPREASLMMCCFVLSSFLNFVSGGTSTSTRTALRASFSVFGTIHFILLFVIQLCCTIVLHNCC